jgi:hypothetical protein
VPRWCLFPTSVFLAFFFTKSRNALDFNCALHFLSLFLLLVLPSTNPLRWCRPVSPRSSIYLSPPGDSRRQHPHDGVSSTCWSVIPSSYDLRSFCFIRALLGFFGKAIPSNWGELPHPVTQLLFGCVCRQLLLLRRLFLRCMPPRSFYAAVNQIVPFIFPVSSCFLASPRSNRLHFGANTHQESGNRCARQQDARVFSMRRSVSRCRTALADEMPRQHFRIAAQLRASSWLEGS